MKDLRRWWPGQAGEAVRLGLTVIASLYLAMLLELSRPEWAAWTVLSVSLSTRASSLQKSAWRVMSTLIGVAMSVLIVDVFAQDTLAFDVVLALWLAVATLLASAARGQDSYGFSLMGFTVPIITLSDVSRPLSIFGVAADRSAALLLGIACATVSAVLVAPGTRQVRCALADRLRATTEACEMWWHTGRTQGVWRDPPVKAVIALDAACIDAFAEQPSLRVGAQPVQAAAPALLSVLATGLLAERLPPKEAISADRLLGWGVPEVGWRLRRAAAAASMLRAGRRAGVRRAFSRSLAFDTDWRQARNNAVRTMVAVSLVNAFWYFSEWSSGAAAVTWTALVAVILAARENPAEAALAFLQGAALADLLGTVAHYTMLTSTGDFPLLAAAVLPLAMLGAAGRADKRATAAAGYGIVVFSALSPLNVETYDLVADLNGIVANLIGVGAAVFAFAALPPPASPAVRRARARRRIARAVRAVAIRPARLLPYPGRWCAPMFERVSLLGPDGEAVAAGHTLLLAGLLLLTLRRHDDALGLRAGRVVTGDGRDIPEALARLLSAAGSDRLQRRRLEMLAHLFERGIPPGFPGLAAA